MLIYIIKLLAEIKTQLNKVLWIFFVVLLLDIFKVVFALFTEQHNLDMRKFGYNGCLKEFYFFKYLYIELITVTIIYMYFYKLINNIQKNINRKNINTCLNLLFA